MEPAPSIGTKHSEEAIKKLCDMPVLSPSI
jgi:hypothetical protein